MIDITDEYSAGYGALFIGLIEALGISWIYGAWNFHKDLQLMLSQQKWKQCGKYYLIAFLGFITPMVIGVILANTIINYTRLASNDTEEIIGWCCAAWVFIWIPALALWEFFKGVCSGEPWRCLQPSKFWGPYLVKHRLQITDIVRFGVDFNLDPRNEIDRKRDKVAQTFANEAFYNEEPC